MLFRFSSLRTMHTVTDATTTGKQNAPGTKVGLTFRLNIIAYTSTEEEHVNFTRSPDANE